MVECSFTKLLWVQVLLQSINFFIIKKYSSASTASFNIDTFFFIESDNKNMEKFPRF